MTPAETADATLDLLSTRIFLRLIATKQRIDIRRDRELLGRVGALAASELKRRYGITDQDLMP